MIKFGHLMNTDGTVFRPPVLKEYKEYIDSIRYPNCTGLDYKCMYCNKCPSGYSFDWPANKRALLVEQNNLQTRYFYMHNPKDVPLFDLEMQVYDNENEEYEVERKSIVYAFDLYEGRICFDLHLPAIYADIFGMFYNPADATMEDLKYVRTVLNWKTNLNDEYTTSVIDQYDGIDIICCDPNNPDPKKMNAMFTIGMNMGDARFRMADCMMPDEKFIFPEGVTKFIVAISMERRI